MRRRGDRSDFLHLSGIQAAARRLFFFAGQRTNDFPAESISQALLHSSVLS